MKASQAVVGNAKLFWILFLILYLGFWSIHGGKACQGQVYIKRNSMFSISAGNPFKLECPVTYCANKPNVTWCKLGAYCFNLPNGVRTHMSWEERKNISAFILYFEQVIANDSGTYRCFADFPPQVTSHSVTIYVTERTQSTSEHPLLNAFRASGAPTTEEVADRQWLLYGLLPLGVMSPLIMICFFLFCCLRRHQGKQKEPSDTARREISQADIPQPLGSEQIEMSTWQNSRKLPSKTAVYDDSWPKIQEESVVYSNPFLEENKQSIVYASLNHLVIGRNPRQARNVKEDPTEYAAICTRSQI
ncbi:B- and T-lymphocyte attenuator isoform X2 [Dasypus novemcinctus]|uniref:B- and T-lymphocyte attenuator isoform X2 n=1 Tax=Dasypus novemcinctus TaxID=9361 RepID=UPI000328E756|nr:B- and T-lymphocyte attenuator isoform X2 [Dasypus novemcinctus]